MIGISVYLQDFDADYLELSASLGVKYVFSSLHIPEERLGGFAETFSKLLSLTQKHALELVVDISPATFEKLGLKMYDFNALKTLGITNLRLDYGFDDYTLVKQLQKNFTLFLNASVLGEKYLQDAHFHHIDLTKIKAFHNFYPKEETGMSKNYLIQQNNLLKKYHLETLAFTVGDEKKRFPLYQGLPTLEKHRATPPLVAGVELLVDCDVKHLVIGDTQAKNDTLRRLLRFQNEAILEIPTHFEKGYTHLFHTPYTIRKEKSDAVFRLITQRTPEVPQTWTGKRHKGTLTMENHLAARYSGEIQLCKKELPQRPEKNTIGFIHPEFVELVDFIHAGITLEFVPLD